MAHTAAVPPSRPISPARSRGQHAGHPNLPSKLDRGEHRHTINTGGTAAKPTTDIKINNTTYTENLTSSVQRLSPHTRLGAYRDRVAARRGRNIAAVAAARELVELVYYALRDHTVRRLAPRIAA